MRKRLAVRKRQVLFIVEASDGFATRQVAWRLNISIYAARNAMQELRRLKLVKYIGSVWYATQAGKDWVAQFKPPQSTSQSSSSSPASPQAQDTAA